MLLQRNTGGLPNVVIYEPEPDSLVEKVAKQSKPVTGKVLPFATAALRPIDSFPTAKI